MTPLMESYCAHRLNYEKRRAETLKTLSSGRLNTTPAEIEEMTRNLVAFLRFACNRAEGWRCSIIEREHTRWLPLQSSKVLGDYQNFVRPAQWIELASPILSSYFREVAAVFLYCPVEEYRAWYPQAQHDGWNIALVAQRMFIEQRHIRFLELISPEGETIESYRYNELSGRLEAYFPHVCGRRSRDYKPLQGYILPNKKNSKRNLRGFVTLKFCKFCHSSLKFWDEWFPNVYGQIPQIPPVPKKPYHDEQASSSPTTISQAINKPAFSASPPAKVKKPAPPASPQPTIKWLKGPDEPVTPAQPPQKVSKLVTPASPPSTMNKPTPPASPPPLTNKSVTSAPPQRKPIHMTEPTLLIERYHHTAKKQAAQPQSEIWAKRSKQLDTAEKYLWMQSAWTMANTLCTSSDNAPFLLPATPLYIELEQPQKVQGFECAAFSFLPLASNELLQQWELAVIDPSGNVKWALLYECKKSWRTGGDWRFPRSYTCSEQACQREQEADGAVYRLCDSCQSRVTYFTSWFAIVLRMIAGDFRERVEIEKPEYALETATRETQNTETGAVETKPVLHRYWIIRYLDASVEKGVGPKTPRGSWMAGRQLAESIYETNLEAIIYVQIYPKEHDRTYRDPRYTNMRYKTQHIESKPRMQPMTIARFQQLRQVTRITRVYASAFE